MKGGRSVGHQRAKSLHSQDLYGARYGGRRRRLNNDDASRQLVLGIDFPRRKRPAKPKYLLTGYGSLSIGIAQQHRSLRGQKHRFISA